ncbi:hypothetical protein ILUMI_02340 [Ignelater luminosus]|uniref:Uncharacterized protein n=1 Tax=Ignelater luminosus TaxID=2038154 RepID=A0A8K0DHV1_IGNLU|nr:hypothetical protein ILUMI_02340 [Ignelater luminosus]
MSNSFLPVILVQTLLTYVLIFYLCAAESPSVSKQLQLSPQKVRAFQQQLQKMYPFLKEKDLTDNMKSLLRSLNNRRRRKRGRKTMEGLISSYLGNTGVKENKHYKSLIQDTSTSSQSENSDKAVSKGVARENNNKNRDSRITEQSETTSSSASLLLNLDKEAFRRDNTPRKCTHHEEEDYDDEDEEDEYPPEITTEEEEIEPTFKPQAVPVSDNAIIHKALYQSIVNSIVKEDLPCNIEGYWSSFAGGMLLKIKRRQKLLHIRLFPKTPPGKKGFLLSCGWHLRGKLPFYPRNNVITVNGFNERDRHIATFIGECRICNGVETVTGNWLLGRASRDCRDQRASEELISDIWKREMLTSLRNQRLNKLRGLQRQNKEGNDRRIDFDPGQF